MKKWQEMHNMEFEFAKGGLYAIYNKCIRENTY